MSSKYEFIEGEKANYPISKMCSWAGVSRAGFYEWRGRPASATAERREKLKARIIEIFNEHDQTYGYRRVHHQLGEEGIQAGLELVRSIMVSASLVACQPRPYQVTTASGDDAYSPADLCNRDFSAEAPGTKLVGDITYINTWAGWVYLATVIDCYSRMVIGYAMADHMRTELVTEALDMARTNTHLTTECIFHSDRGSQYTSDDLAKYLKEHEMRGSMGRTGVAWDNALAESFFGILKNEYVHRTVFPTKRKAINAITRWIEIRYNRQRIHSSIDYKTPYQAHINYNNESQAA